MKYTCKLKAVLVLALSFSILTGCQRYDHSALNSTAETVGDYSEDLTHYNYCNYKFTKSSDRMKIGDTAYSYLDDGISISNMYIKNASMFFWVMTAVDGSSAQNVKITFKFDTGASSTCNVGTLYAGVKYRMKVTAPEDAVYCRITDIQMFSADTPEMKKVTDTRIAKMVGQNTIKVTKPGHYLLNDENGVVVSDLRCDKKGKYVVSFGIVGCYEVED